MDRRCVFSGTPRPAMMRAAAPLLATAFALAACSKPEPKPEATPATAAPLRSSEVALCPPCSEAGPAVFYFRGGYLDAKCETQPFAEGDFTACAPIALGRQMILFVAPTNWAKRGTSMVEQLVRQVGKDERLFRKLEDGRCEPYPAMDREIAPLSCEGKYVCRDLDGGLGCGSCARNADGCERHAGSRVLALFGHGDAGAAPAKPAGSH